MKLERLFKGKLEFHFNKRNKLDNILNLMII